MWGATGAYLSAYLADVISIHAPMWGATGAQGPTVKGDGNFNPRTHVGCDLTVNNCFQSVIDFNPRTHVGCDQVQLFYLCLILISIHAPMWGATFFY